MTFKLRATKDCGTIEAVYGTSSRALKAKVVMARKGYVVTVEIVLPTAKGVWS